MNKIDINSMNDEELIRLIKKLKIELKDSVVIPVHHYINKEIVELADFVGDSYKLAVLCSKTDKEFVVFCGVYFMAEGAVVLGSTNQKILLPVPNAMCPMADMADINLVTKAFDKIQSLSGREIVPVVYMNSYADLKSFCGEKGGSVCTSSNAKQIIEYYFKQNKSVLFFPDYYLGRNTAIEMGYKDNELVKVKKDLTLETAGDLNKARFFLWDGFCPVHKRFTLGDIKYLREKHKDIKIIVHPESPEEVVDNSDYSGSTEKIYRTIKDSPPHSVWAVGTETVFVERLAAENPSKTILPLADSKCVNMKKISLQSLAGSLLSIKEYLNNKSELKYLVNVEDKFKQNAKKSLLKMIEIVEGNKP